jgi:hypothetical protein
VILEKPFSSEGIPCPQAPDITVRVDLYKTALVEQISKGNVFGTSVGYVYTMEFQKRGLPHIHLLLSLFPSFRLGSPKDVDTVIRAAWPDPVKEPRLFSIVNVQWSMVRVDYQSQMRLA